MEFVFDDRGLLLPGVHDVSIDDVQEYFGRFQRSDRRLTLFGKLTEFLETVKRADCCVSVIIDGGFVMAKVDEPEDIDLVLVLRADWDQAAELRPFQYNVVSKKAVKRMFGFDAISAKVRSESEAEWIEFFGGVNIKWCQKFGWPDDTRKGIVRVKL